MDFIKSIERIASVREFVAGGSLTSFGSGGVVRAVVYPTDERCLIRTLCALNEYGIRFRTIGNGTNTLIADGGYEGVLISLKNLAKLTLNDGEIHAGAGARLKRVVALAAENGLVGLEFAEGIPATVGGAIVMNAGAYGAQIGDYVTEIKVLTGRNVVTWKNEAIGFRYRGSNISHDNVVVSAVFGLGVGDKDEIARRLSGFAEKREFSQPQGRSAGSVFKKAGAISAGYYLDKLGFKGRRIGGAKVSEKHANFIVNTGGATTADYLKLAAEMEEAVYYEYGIRLEKEVELIGE